MSVPVANAALLPPGVAGARPVTAQPGRGGSNAAVVPSGQSFADVLAQRAGATEPPRFSRHALDRLQQRGIEVGGPMLERLTGGVARAAGKGSRDSVVFVDGTAFVVSVKNNTVITAVGSEHMREQVFTNIDSAVIA
jgi:flagellar operon protein